MTSDVLPAESISGGVDMRSAMPRMGIALLALAGVFVSLYLFLFKIGAIGSLLCGVDGGCDIVQASSWASILGIPVAAFGIAGYLLIVVVALLGLQPARIDDRRIAGGLLLLGSGAFAFSVYLTVLEAYVIHAWCRWCVASAVIATLIFVLSLFEIPRLKRAGHG